MCRCRGAGRPEAACDIERAMDRFALALGIDPVDVRLRNVVAPDRFPYRTAVGSTYDSGEYARAINKVVESSRYRALRSEQATRRARGDRTQIGSVWRARPRLRAGVRSSPSAG